MAGQSPSRHPVPSLAGVLIWTSPPRFGEMRRFYVEVLGMEPRSDRPGFVNFEWGSTRLTIGIHDRIDGLALDPLRIMVNLAVDNLSDLHPRLLEAGVLCLRPPSPEPWGGMVATYADPDGNTVQLITFSSDFDGIR